MKFETTKQNRPRTPNGLMTSIQSALNKKQLVIHKIFHAKKGWAIEYAYASNSKLPPIKRMFKDTTIFRYYESIEQCLKGEYNRIVLGVDDGYGTMNDAPIEVLIEA